MLGGDVDGAVEPADRPAVKVEAVEHGLVAQRGKELVLLDERQAVEDALAAVVEGQVQPVAVKCAGCCDPFQSVEVANLWHIVSFLSFTATNIRNIPQTYSFPIEKLTNRHEKGRERLRVLAKASEQVRAGELAREWPRRHPRPRLPALALTFISKTFT